LLRDKMKSLIESSLKKYDSSILGEKNLIKSIDAKSMTLNDLHLILKITKTLPIIEKYQLESKPSLKPLQNFDKEVEKTIRIVKKVNIK
jgi:hypothetical protein